MSTLYKIRSSTTGLYSTGGNMPRWSKFGKIWAVKGHLNSHFTGLSSEGKRIYRNAEAEVVEIEIVAKNPIPVQSFIEAVGDRKLAREAEEQRLAKLRREKRALAVLAGRTE